jgi:hypothetical protein
MRRFGPGLGVLVFFAAVGLAYAMASPYGARPDEPTHYVKALATGGGDVLGRPARFPGDRSARQAAYIDSVTRRFRVPARLAPPVDDGRLCFVLQADRPADCPHTSTGGPEQLSYVGVYPPLPYLVPGVAARLGTGEESGMLAARLASGLCALVLVGVAVAALGGPRPAALPLLGLAVVLWPGLMFLVWAVNPNGTEIVASLAFFATLLALTRDGEPPRWLWTAAAASGFVLTTSRPLAPVWVAFGLLVAVTLHGPRRAVRRARAGGRQAVLLGTALVVGGLSTVAWDLLMHTHVQPDSTPRLQLVGPALRSLRPWLDEMVGRLGWGEAGLSPLLYHAWFVALVVLAAAALAVGTWRERVACVVAAAAVVATTVFFVVVTHPSGFPTGGRYVQAGAAAMPLLWTEVLARNRTRLPAWSVPAAVGGALALVAVTQVDALYRNGRRFAVGVDGPAGYLLHGARWTPPGGWWPWVACAALGLAALIAGFATGLVTPGPRASGSRTPR